MNRILAIIMLTCGFCLSANADIWKYVDEKGKTHFVDTNSAIYTWLDEFDKRHYADVPGHICSRAATANSKLVAMKRKRIRVKRQRSVLKESRPKHTTVNEHRRFMTRT